MYLKKISFNFSPILRVFARLATTNLRISVRTSEIWVRGYISAAQSFPFSWVSVSSPGPPEQFNSGVRTLNLPKRHNGPYQN